MTSGYHCRLVAMRIGANTPSTRTNGQKVCSAHRQFQKVPRFEGCVFAHSRGGLGGRFERKLQADRARPRYALANNPTAAIGSEIRPYIEVGLRKGGKSAVEVERAVQLAIVPPAVEVADKPRSERGVFTPARHDGGLAEPPRTTERLRAITRAPEVVQDAYRRRGGVLTLVPGGCIASYPRADAPPVNVVPDERLR